MKEENGEIRSIIGLLIVWPIVYVRLILVKVRMALTTLSYYDNKNIINVLPFATIQ